MCIPNEKGIAILMEMGCGKSITTIAIVEEHI